MKKLRKTFYPILALILLVSLAMPASALFFSKAEADADILASFTKNGMVNQVLSFQKTDFASRVYGDGSLESIVITKLPDVKAGVLKLAGTEVPTGATIESGQLDQLKFYPTLGLAGETAKFSFVPVFSSGSATEASTVSIYLLKAQNNAPVAEDLSLSTYKNIAANGTFSAVDPEGDKITFQLTDKPARGEVTYEENSASFVYTPYENKTGKDSFTYVAVDAVGNVSEPATVKVVIQKPATKVTYSDMEGQGAHAAAIRLAEANIFVGECMGGTYFFRPDEAVTRSEFLAAAMNAAGVTDLSTVGQTGFADDAQIPVWAKGYAATALKSGVIEGMKDENGRVVFAPSADMTVAEAAVLLNRVLEISDVNTSAAGEGTGAAPVWAAQSVVNLETCGILTADSAGALRLDRAVTRADMARMLSAAMDLLENRKDTGLFPW